MSGIAVGEERVIRPWRKRPWQVRLIPASGFSLGFHFYRPFLLKLLIGVREVWIGYQRIPLREQRRMRAACAETLLSEALADIRSIEWESEPDVAEVQRNLYGPEKE